MHLARISQSATLVIAVAQKLASVHDKMPKGALTLNTRLTLGLLGALGVLVAGCSARSACAPIATVSPPYVQQLYPIPGTSGVPDAVGLMVFASTQTVPIRLIVGENVTATTSVAVPAVLPSPAATPSSVFPAPPAVQRFAVSLPSLKAATFYTTQALITDSDTCGPTTQSFQSIATFSTK